MRELEKPLLDELGYKRLRPVWAKLELFLGLSAAALGVWLLGQEEARLVGTGGLLFVLGFYLALAGHRSHLYQSQTRLAAYVLGVGAPAATRNRSKTGERGFLGEWRFHAWLLGGSAFLACVIGLAAQCAWDRRKEQISTAKPADSIGRKVD